VRVERLPQALAATRLSNDEDGSRERAVDGNRGMMIRPQVELGEHAFTSEGCGEN
jgi:hypothetical protein